MEGAQLSGANSACQGTVDPRFLLPSAHPSVSIPNLRTHCPALLPTHLHPCSLPRFLPPSLLLPLQRAV
jgi:hypothetical protein